MAELLSMTLLSAEPVSAAKPQSGLSNNGSTEPDQSFAATLAAEVNGKAPEKNTKTSAKTRQNTASEAVDSKESANEQGAVTADKKNDSAKSVTQSTSEQSENEEALATDPQVLSAQHEQADAEQSEWLNLLEKAKSLNERFSKTEAEGESKEVQTKTKAALDQASANVKQQSDLSKATDLLAGTAVQSTKTKNADQKQGAIPLGDTLAAEQSSEQQLTEEELSKLKLVSQADKAAASQQQSEDRASKQSVTVRNPDIKFEYTSEMPKKPVDRTLHAIQKDTGSDQHKIMAHVEKSLKTSTEPGLTAQATDVLEAGAEVTMTVSGKAQSQLEQNSALMKSASSGTADNKSALEAQTDTDTDTKAPQATSVEPKLSVQAQSAAAIVAPVTQQTKAPAADVKVTTEEVLKQLQTATTAAQAEQGSSSSGESSQQGSAETLVTVIEQQKNTTPVVAEANSFSSQLKNSLEKSNAGISVAGREAVSEASQKQADQLGQKLNLIQPQASEQLKEKMLMMVKDKVHTAEIRLDPSELGSMQIKINLQQDQMSVQFMVQQGNAKELMEQQMPKLRELLQQQGIELSQGSVQQQNQSSSGQEGGRGAAGGNGMATALDTSDELIEPAILPTKSSDRVVDYYA